MSQSGDKKAAAEGTIETLMHEERVYAPSAEFAAQANAHDPGVYEWAERDPEGYWREQAKLVDWFKAPTQVLDWKPPFAKWYHDGVLNASYNCLDRHVATHGSKRALVWEGEPGEVRTFTYAELHREVNRAAQMLKNLGVGKGDRVAVYMPMIPEAAI